LRVFLLEALEVAARAFGAVALSLTALALPASAAADTVIATERAPSKLSADQSRVVWSSYDPVTGNYYLTSRDTQGAITRIPIGPRKVPFDVDLGYVGEGEEVAVYSRCRIEPAAADGAAGVLPVWATGRGCDLYQFAFDGPSGRESRITRGSTRRASEFLPAVWGGRLVFARVYERRRGLRGRVPYLYARRVRGSRRLPGGLRGATGLPGPTSIDLLVRRLGFSWDWKRASGGSAGSEIRLDTYGGQHRLLARLRAGLVFRDLLSPSVSPSSVDFASVASGGAPEEASEYFRYMLASRDVLTAAAPHPLVSVSRDFVNGLTYYLRAQDIKVPPPACGQPAASPPPTCVVSLADPIAFGH